MKKLILIKLGGSIISDKTKINKARFNVIKDLSKAIDEGRAAAFVTVILVDGSTPREAGAKMLVFEDGSIRGTVGGGTLEALSIKQAVDCLKRGESGKFIFDLKPKGNTGMICMGKMEVFWKYAISTSG